MESSLIDCDWMCKKRPLPPPSQWLRFSQNHFYKQICKKWSHLKDGFLEFFCVASIRTVRNASLRTRNGLSALSSPCDSPGVSRWRRHLDRRLDSPKYERLRSWKNHYIDTSDRSTHGVENSNETLYQDFELEAHTLRLWTRSTHIENLNSKHTH